MTTRAALAMTLASAVLWSLCFRAAPDPLLVWVALFPLVLVTLRWQSGAVQHFLLGWLHGTLSWLIQVPWIAATIETYGGLPWLASKALWLLMAVYLGLFHALWMAAGRVLVRRFGQKALLEARSFLLPIVQAALWVLLEDLRGVMISGFPWNLAGFGAVATPGALDITRWIGSFGLSFLVVAVNVSLALSFVALRSTDSERRFGQVIARCALPAGVALALFVALISADSETRVRFESDTETRPATEESATGDALQVLILQPNSGILDQEDAGAPQRNYRQVLSQLDGFCRTGGRLAIAPESAFFPYTWQYSGVLRQDLMDRLRPGCALLLNSAFWEDDETVYNTALLVNDQGMVERYRKNHLVPYGEYVPLADLIPFIGTLARQAGGFTAGSEVTLLPYGGERFGVSICFEIVFPREVAERVRAGASTLVTITNDAWYGDTWAPWQHLVAARFRAAESHKPVMRAALTGVSAAIDERGQLVASLGVDERGTLAIELEPEHGPGWTVHSRFPWLTTVVSAAMAVLAIGFGRPKNRTADRS